MEPAAQTGLEAPARTDALILTILDNYILAFRFAFGRSVRRSDFNHSPRLLTAVIAASAVGFTLAERLVAGAGAEFWIWGAMASITQSVAWGTLVMTVLGLLRQTSQALAVLALLVQCAAPVALFSVLLTVPLIALELPADADDSAVLVQALMVWTALLLCRACHLFSDCSVIRAILAGVLYWCGLVLVVSQIPSAPVFYQPAAAQSESALDVEGLYYRQTPLIEQQFAALAPQNAADIDLYFLTVGAFSAEDVFMREALGAMRIADAALGTRARSLALINNSATQHRYPLANNPNLRRSLARMGDLIDRENDVVFLFLTSHGSEKAYLATEFGSAQPHDISASQLRRALDNADIRWRIIVISACYAGSFLPALADQYSLVITAAAADRSSFGCRHENDWTYFGQAYWAEAIARGLDPVSAFEYASAAITAREAREGKRASQPQMSLGAALKDHLEKWSAQRGVTQAADSTNSR